MIKTEDPEDEEDETLNILNPVVIIKSRAGRTIKQKPNLYKEEDDKPKKSRVKKGLEMMEPKIELTVKNEIGTVALEKDPEMEALVAPKAPPKKRKRKRKVKTEYYCCFCRDLFETEQDLLSHMNFVHSTETTNNMEQKYPNSHKYECKYCKIKFRLRSSVEQHLLDKDFKEPKKDRIAEYQKRKLNMEGKSKEDQKVICIYCGRLFGNITQQREHELRTHAESFPFQCPHPGCDKRFAGESILKIHLKTHGERHFSCNVSSLMTTLS